MRSGPIRRGTLEGRRRERRWPRVLLTVALLVVAASAALLAFGPAETLRDGNAPDPQVTAPVPEIEQARADGPRRKRERRVTTGSRSSPRRRGSPIRHEFGDAPRAGVMFDVATGEVLWARHPDRELPIASLTKMMTAHLIARSHSPDEKVKVSSKAVRTGGSMVGVLPAGEKVPLGGLLKGLLLVSGNDAATALAEHDAGSVPKFVQRMNEEAERLGLDCTRFTSPHGLEDKGNHSCPRDLAELARANLANARVASIVRSDRESVPFPIEGGALELYNINPFIRAGDPTITGVKTGYTDAAGRCYVTTAERGGRELGVVLLDSPDPLSQVPKLLELGAAA